MKFGVVLFVALVGFFSGHSYSSEQDPVNEIVSQVTKLDNPQLADSAAFVSHDLSPWGMYLAADVIVKTVMIGPTTSFNCVLGYFYREAYLS
ncbi:hypothetical protein LOC50_15835 [Pseudoalteromonas sp. SCSIO 43095]|uniref:hypothetical protein n=1 Tax=Pseudoalteromonas sp. SCSIO 43095 TaxID=2894202 RepID=UPI00202ADEBF|nr:hypothetical protein [Pseudoalteromonas sp. SCSIO 43095]URR00145.1 hypothetical protein LOC50_15835 [Pseudoalteromonas sp. SCSIO 43095]